MLVRLSGRRSKATWLVYRLWKPSDACWTNDPSQPPTINVGILCTQTDVDRTIATQTEIGCLHMFRGFVSVDWGHVNFEEETSLPTWTRSGMLSKVEYRSRVEHRPMHDVLLPMHIWNLDWSQRCISFENSIHRTDCPHAQLIADIRRLYNVKDSFSDSAKQYFQLPL